MFNFSGSEIVFLLLIALIILGPEKLPDAVRKFGKTYAEFKKVTSGFQSELRSALDEPMKEMRETADALKKAANFDVDTDLGLKGLFTQDGSAVDPPTSEAPVAESAPADPAAASTAPVAMGEEPPIEIAREPGPRFTSAAPIE